MTIPDGSSQDSDDDDDSREGLGLGSISINPLLQRIADLFNMTASTLRSPTSASSGGENSRRDNDDEDEDGQTKKNQSGKGKGQQQGTAKGTGKTPSPSGSQGKYSIDTSDITVVKKNMFREGKVHFYTASLPGFI